jgi:hypothetical protein
MTTTANTRGRPRDAHGLPQVHRADMEPRSLDRHRSLSTGGAGLRPYGIGIGVRSAGWRSRRRSLPAGRVAVLPPWSHR